MSFGVFLSVFLAVFLAWDASDAGGGDFGEAGLIGAPLAALLATETVLGEGDALFGSGPLGEAPLAAGFTGGFAADLDGTFAAALALAV
jgi:hypothetical protein